MGVYGDSRTKLTFLLFRTLVKLNDLFCCLIIYCNPAEPIQTLFSKMTVFELVGSPARMGKNSFATCWGKTVVVHSHGPLRDVEREYRHFAVRHS